MKRVFYAVCVILLLFLIEQVFQLPYMTKTLIKLPLFTVLPLLGLKTKKVKPKGVHLHAIIVSIGVFMIICIAYFILSRFIDVSTIQEDFTSRMKITNGQYIAIGFYTIFVNAFIEELFFRSYLLKPSLKYVIISSALFAIYHIAIFGTWFTWPIFLLALTGLFVGGLIFSYFTIHYKSFLSAYLIHMAADAAIVLIGYQMLVA